MKTKLLFMLILGGSIIFTSCTKYPPESDRTMDALAVFTKYDVNADFSQYSTYAIPDSIYFLSDTDSGKISNSNTALVINQIVKNMNERGYTRVAANANPDLAFNLAVDTKTTVTVYYPDYWWGYYPPYYYGGWYGWGYYYPYYPVVTSYTSGTLSMELADFLTAQNQRIYIRWNAIIRGLLTGGHSASELTNSIDQAFIQTPQLTK
jgi:hypothetical protein